MKKSFLLSVALVVATTSVALGSVTVQYSDVFYSIVPCVFLLLLAVGDYGRQSRLHRIYETVAVDAVASRKQSLRLAA